MKKSTHRKLTLLLNNQDVNDILREKIENIFFDPDDLRNEILIAKTCKSIVKKDLDTMDRAIFIADCLAHLMKEFRIVKKKPDFKSNGDGHIWMSHLVGLLNYDHLHSIETLNGLECKHFLNAIDSVLEVDFDGVTSMPDVRLREVINSLPDKADQIIAEIKDMRESHERRTKRLQGK